MWQLLSGPVAVAISCVIVVRLFILLVKFYKKRKLFWKMPGHEDFHPLMGSMHLFPGPDERGIKWDLDCVKKFKKFHRIWAGPFIPVLVCFHPDAIRPILKSSAPKPRNAWIASPYDMGLPWLGEGLLISNGDKWTRNRRLLTNAFHFDILLPYVEIYNRAADVLLNKIEKLAQKNQSFELFSLISLCSLDIILQCAFSNTSNYQLLGESHPYVLAVSELLDLWTLRSVNPFLHPNIIYFNTANGRRFLKNCDYVHKVAEEIIAKRKQELEDQKRAGKRTNKKYIDFLDILLTAQDENGIGLTKLEIRNEVDTFLFEGHDTTTSGLCWMLYNMARLPQHQQAIQEEVDGILAGKDNQDIEWDDLSKFEVLTRCLKESIRLHTPVPFIERQITEEVKVDDYTIPPGTLVAMNLFCLHHNPYVWDEPEEFRPERFAPASVQKMDPFAFTPFSAGSRNCIGQNFAMHEMKVLIARILQKFTLEVDPNHTVLRLQRAVLKAENGIKVFARPRKV